MLFHPPKNPVELKVMHLNKTQQQRREDLMEATQGKAALKQLKKSMAKKAKQALKVKSKSKKKDKNKETSQQVFVLDFDGDIKASAVKHLREEISTLISTANKGDEVIIPAPYWVSYPDMVILADATPIIVETGLEQDFKITPEQLQASITNKTKLFVMNSPSNPTGAVYSKGELLALANVLKEHPHVLIITDDIYEHISWGNDDFINIVMADNTLKERTIILNGVSKGYAMTGWRIGYGAGPETIIKAMKKIQGQSTSNPCSIAQAAALEALNGDQSIIDTMVSAFEERHDFIVNALNAIDGIECPRSQGAFYSFPRVEGLIKRLGLKDDVELSTYCLEELNIALVPGSAFGAPGYVRFSFATSMDNIKQAVDRLSNV